LSATISQYFIGGMMPDSASGLQQSATIIEIRPYRGGWQCFEGPGVAPFWTGNGAKEDAISYAEGRARFGRGEIRVLNPDRTVASIIPFDGSSAKL
jgi:hypothetical protein